MNNLFSKFRVSVIAGALGLGVVSTPLIAVEDVLNTASVKSVMAKDNLLLDLAKAGQRIVAVGSRGHILFTDDKGESWQQANVPISVMLTAVSFVDSWNGWAVGHSGVILHTADAGENWQVQFDGDQANKMIITQSEQLLAKMQAELEVLPEDEQEDLVYEIEEAEFALEDARFDAEVGASKPLLDVLFSSKDEGFVVGAYGYIFKTNDGGKTWANYGSRVDNPDRFHLNAISHIGDGTLLAVGEAGVIFRSTDSGETWEGVESPYNGSFFGVTGTGDKDVALVFGLRGNLFRTEDAGDTWSSIDAGTESTLMSADSNGKGFMSIVGNSGTVLFSRDKGRTFSESIREDRLGNASGIYVTPTEMILVGERGINNTTPAGLDL